MSHSLNRFLPLSVDDHADLFRFVHDNSLGDETDALELKSEWDLMDKKKPGNLAKLILGFANRGPTVAAKYFGGEASLVLGVDAGRAKGVTKANLSEVQHMIEAHHETLRSMSTAMKDVQVEPADVDAVATAAETLDLQPRQGRWGHLSLSVLDATWSINADYDSHVVPVVHRYAEWSNLPSVQFRGSELARPISPRDDEQTLSAFLDSIADISDETLAEDVLRNSQRTSTRSGVLKSAAVRQIAGILVDHQIETLADVSALLADVQRVTAVEEALAEVPGHGFNAIRTGYLWMNAGGDQHVKPDRHILSWLTETVDREVTVREARALLAKAAAKLHVTPWVLDHAIWVHKTRG